MGSPAAVNPQGTVIAGCPDKLNGIVPQVVSGGTLFWVSRENAGNGTVGVTMA